MNRKKIWEIVATTVMVLALLGLSQNRSALGQPLTQSTGTTTRVSVASNGTEGNQNSWWASISADGRFVAFGSWADNLVIGDTNACNDVFVHDRQTGETTRVSVASDGTEGNGNSQLSRIPSSISADGRFVTFISEASNLVSGDTNGRNDVFVHDRQTRETTRVSVASDGTEGNSDSWSSSISADGRYVALESSAENLTEDDYSGWEDIFVHDRQTQETTRVSVASDGTEGDCYSLDSSISANGRFVAFWSKASNLVEKDSNSYEDVFVHDRQTGQTMWVSVASDGTEGDEYSWYPSISADGRYVAFESGATNLVTGDTNYWQDVFVRDRFSTTIYLPLVLR